jgi:4-hydroxy-2-oxoheptanedioate aldolase
MKNSIRNRMLAGETVFGTWCMLPSSSVIDVIARTGVDFVVIDMEHGSISLETAENMVRAAQLRGCQPIIRVGDDQDNTILHALETGCEAILVPNVSTVEATKRIAMASRYSPLGTRGLSPYTSCHGYSHEKLNESLLYHEKNTLVGILVEGKLGIENLKEIIKVPGIDLIYLGTYDISQSVGHAGQLEHPKVLEAMQYSVEIIKQGGKLAGTFARDINACKKFKSIGFEFIAYVADSYGLSMFYSESVKSFWCNK